MMTGLGQVGKTIMVHLVGKVVVWVSGVTEELTGTATDSVENVPFVSFSWNSSLRRRF